MYNVVATQLYIRKLYIMHYLRFFPLLRLLRINLFEYLWPYLDLTPLAGLP